MRVFVTGGSGFIGLRFVRTLLEAGHEVVCLSRSGGTSAKLSELGAEVLSGDLSNAESVHASVQEAKPTHVAHLAAEIATQRSADAIQAVNVRGTESLVAGCRDLDLEKFLFLSSVVRGEADGQVLTEDSPIPATTEYGKSKQRGDEILMHAHEEWGLPSVILRPSHVYGAGGWFETLINDRMFRLPGKGDNMWDVVHVDDVVSACVTLLEKAPAGEIYHVVDDEPVTMKQFFGFVAKALGRKPYGHAQRPLDQPAAQGPRLDAQISQLGRSDPRGNSRAQGRVTAPPGRSCPNGRPGGTLGIRMGKGVPMNRRSFLVRMGGAVVAVPAVLQLTACGGGDDGGGGIPDADNSQFNVSSTMSGHVHQITVKCTDIQGSSAVTYTSTTVSAHNHDVMITAAELGMINSGTSVTINTTSGGHNHAWTISKPSTACT